MSTIDIKLRKGTELYIIFQGRTKVITVTFDKNGRIDLEYPRPQKQELSQLTLKEWKRRNPLNADL